MCVLSQSLDLCLSGWLPILLVASVQCLVLDLDENGEFQNLRLSVDCCLDSLEVDLTDGLNHPYCWPNFFMIIYGMHTIH